MQNQQLVHLFGKKNDAKDLKKIDEIAKKVVKIDRLKSELSTALQMGQELKTKIDERSLPFRKELVEKKQELVLLYIEKYGEKGFTESQNMVLDDLIDEEYDTLMQMDVPVPDEFLEKYETHHKSMFENMDSEDKEILNEEFKEFMDNSGFPFGDIFGDIDVHDFFAGDFKEKMSEKLHEKQQEFFENEKLKEKKQKVAKTDLDFQKIYKNLAKQVHPDIFTNSEEKHHKDELMKSLSSAWDERDYYTLLMLGFEIDPEFSNKILLSDNSKKSLVKYLNSSLADLESEIYMLKNRSEFARYFYITGNLKTEKGRENRINKFINVLEQGVTETQQNIEITNNKAKLKKKLNAIYRNNYDSDDFYYFE